MRSVLIVAPKATTSATVTTIAPPSALLSFATGAAFATFTTIASPSTFITIATMPNVELLVLLLLPAEPNIKGVKLEIDGATLHVGTTTYTSKRTVEARLPARLLSHLHRDGKRHRRRLQAGSV